MNPPLLVRELQEYRKKVTLEQLSYSLLELVKATVDSAQLEQFLVPSFFAYLTVVQNEDLIGVADRRESVGDDD